MKLALRPGATAAGLAFTAGFVDTAGFIALFGLFTAHVTGNFVLIGAALVTSSGGLLGKLLALPMFVVAVALARGWVLRCEQRNADAGRTLLFAQAGLLALFMGLGIEAAPVLQADAPLAIAAGMAGVAAMGLQNAASRTVFADHAPTTVMTGNVTQLVMDTVDLTVGRATAPTRARLAKMGPPVASFAAGALGGAFGFATIGFWCLLGPLVVVVAIAAARKPQAPA